MNEFFKLGLSRIASQRQNYRIVSVDAEKAFDKIKQPFQIKTLSEIEMLMQERCLTNKDGLQQQVQFSVGTWQKYNLLKAGTRQGCALLLLHWTLFWRSRLVKGDGKMRWQDLKWKDRNTADGWNLHVENMFPFCFLREVVTNEHLRCHAVWHITDVLIYALSAWK